MFTISVLLVTQTIFSAKAQTQLDLKVSCGWPTPTGANRSLTYGTFHKRRAMRFFLDIDDKGLCKADIRRGNYNRAELRSASLPHGRKLHIDYDIYIPKPFRASGGIAIGQFHQARKKPLVLLWASSKRYWVSTGTGLRKLGANVVLKKHLFDAQAYGSWQRIRMEALFSNNKDGFIKVYANGTLKFEAIGANVATQPYFKIGLYGRKARMEAPLTVFVTQPKITFY